MEMLHEDCVGISLIDIGEYSSKDKAQKGLQQIQEDISGDYILAHIQPDETNSEFYVSVQVQCSGKCIVDQINKLGGEITPIQSTGECKKYGQRVSQLLG